MLTQKSIKLSDYVVYPFQIPNINLDFNIFKEEVFVQAIMKVKLVGNKNSRLILHVIILKGGQNLTDGLVPSPPV